MRQGHLNALSTMEAEGILCGVMKRKNLIFAKGKKHENMLSQEYLYFSPFKTVFSIILHQTCVVVTHLVTNVAGNYKLQYLCYWMLG